MSPRPSLLRSTLIFSSGTFVSRILGLVREQAIAYAFGANAATDAFWVAFRIPNFLRRLFAEGSFSVAFVPVFTEVKEKRSHEDLKQLVARTAGTLGGVLLVVTALGVLGAGWVARGFAPGSIDEPVKLALTTDLLRITFPFLLFVSLTALAGGVLNSFHRFGLPALTPVILNLCMIAGALWLAPHLDTPIMALGWAIFAAGILQLLVQLPALRALDLLSMPRWGWNHPDVRRIMRLMVPTLFGSSVAQINLLLDTLIASFLIAGSQTWLAQTDRLLEFPLGIFGVALGTVILPSLSRHHVATDREGFAKALDWGLRTALLISVPAMLALVLLAKPILATLLQHGRFTAHDVDMAALSLSALSFGLPAFALVKVVAPAFYARQDTKTPVRAGIVAMIANMVMNIVFVALLFALWHTPEQGGRRLARRDREGARPAHGPCAGERARQLSQSRAALDRPSARRHLRRAAGLGRASRAARRFVRGDGCGDRRVSCGVVGLERVGNGDARAALDDPDCGCGRGVCRGVVCDGFPAARSEGALGEPVGNGEPRLPSP